jgi:hypothetical protein
MSSAMVGDNLTGRMWPPLGYKVAAIALVPRQSHMAAAGISGPQAPR